MLNLRFKQIIEDLGAKIGQAHLVGKLNLLKICIFSYIVSGSVQELNKSNASIRISELTQRDLRKEESTMSRICPQLA